MSIKNAFRAVLFFFSKPELQVVASIPSNQFDSCVLPKAMHHAKGGNHLSMRHISLIFGLEFQRLDDEFYLCASNLWAYLAARRGDWICASKLLAFMHEHPNQALPVPLIPSQGTVGFEGDILKRLCLLPEHCNPGLLYDLIPLMGGMMYLLRAYPAESGAQSWEDSCFQELLLNRNFSPIPRCCRSYSPTSIRGGKSLHFWQIIAMFIDALHSYIREIMDKRHSIDL